MGSRLQRSHSTALLYASICYFSMTSTLVVKRVGSLSWKSSIPVKAGFVTVPSMVLNFEIESAPPFSISSNFLFASSSFLLLLAAPIQQQHTNAAMPAVTTNNPQTQA
eukprot:m.52337 g.52337  ORF g.52337 m.52337 type:complete len:108 (-) comp7618_c0_seq2:104-427(-)